MTWDPQELWDWGTEQRAVDCAKAHWNFPVNLPRSKQFPPVEHRARQISPPSAWDLMVFQAVLHFHADRTILRFTMRLHFHPLMCPNLFPLALWGHQPAKKKSHKLVSVSSRFLVCGLVLLLINTACVFCIFVWVKGQHGFPLSTSHPSAGLGPSQTGTVDLIC